MKKSNPDIDEQKEGVSYEKGLAFEKQFASFLRKELGWSKVRVGAHMPGKYNAKGTSIDIFCERLDYQGIKYRKIADRLMFGSAILAIFSFIWYIEKWAHHGIYLFIFSLIAFAGVALCRILSDQYNKQNAWVECKNLKTKVDINHISKMLREFNDYKASKQDDHKFTHLYFASANGYVENALKMADNNKIICYIQKDNSFEEVKYWN